MPLEKMRFFINEDRREPRCFGIYQDEYTGHWVVYKNKADGSRAVRYSGPDEAYAAQEIWAKINSEIELRRAKAASAAKKPTKAQKIRNAAVIALIVAGIGLYAYHEYKKPHRGYYVYDDNILYYQDYVWYYFDDYFDEWERYDAPSDGDWYEDAWYGDSYPFEEQGDAFLYSDYYEEPSQNDSDSSIFDSWDSFDTDWDSDW